jgi:hypothetical protein
MDCCWVVGCYRGLVITIVSFFITIFSNNTAKCVFNWHVRTHAPLASAYIRFLVFLFFIFPPCRRSRQSSHRKVCVLIFKLSARSPFFWINNQKVVTTTTTTGVKKKDDAPQSLTLASASMYRQEVGSSGRRKFYVYRKRERTVSYIIQDVLLYFFFLPSSFL